MYDGSLFEVLSLALIIIGIVYLIGKILALYGFAFMACNVFGLKQTKRGFLFLGILGGCLSFVIALILAVTGISSWNIYLMEFIDLICVFVIVYFVRK